MCTLYSDRLAESSQHPHLLEIQFHESADGIAACAGSISCERVKVNIQVLKDENVTQVALVDGLEVNRLMNIEGKKIFVFFSSYKGQDP